ncbi:hypothetical protein M404DRAFT_34600 [Pisolithus tinctorius Marx 270]|uniref:Uncharacterized protein n=1 Tax=Pisolithus tinctorius Marx 270 TaxID=870435 RepID=A0A0C3ICZ0_PISTI|nr:hypothetical protein M404DRAFT_34600 [Pisolithus tinctorius Marx 270]
MAPKRDAAQPKDASPPKCVRIAASSLVSSTPTTCDTIIQRTPPPTSMVPTTSNLQEPDALLHPPSNDSDPTSTPSTGTLPSTTMSITTDTSSAHQTTDCQSQETPPPPSQSTPATVSSGTISAIGKTPNPCLFDPNRVSTCPEPLLKRIKTLSTYSNPDANTFALGCILPTAMWGATDPYKDRSKVLCNPSTNQPINIWVLGHITSTWFLKNGAPNNQCSVTVLSLSSKLGQYVNLLLSEFSVPSPPINEYDHGLVQTVRWQSSKSGGDTVLFNSIYDAREILKNKSAMTKLDISYLEKRALVLLECHLNCYHQKDDHGRWTISKAQFELQAIYLLQDPCHPNPDQASNSGVEIAGLAI